MAARFMAVLLVAVLAGCAGTSTASFDRPGFFTKVEGGRLWVFREGSKELAEFKAKGEPAQQVTRIGAGPNGMSIKAPDSATIDSYLQTKG